MKRVVRLLLFGWFAIPVMLVIAGLYWLFDNDYYIDVLIDLRRSFLSR